MNDSVQRADLPSRDDLVTEARSWMLGKGTRWTHQGRLKYVGVDCLGLLGMSAFAMGLPGSAEWRADREFHNYGRLSSRDRFFAGCDRFSDRIPIAEAGVGDALVMAFHGNLPQHFALISRVEPMYLIHAYTSIGRVAENGVAVAGARIVRAYRFRGLA